MGRKGLTVIFQIALVIFLTEGAIMFILPQLDLPEEEWVHSLVDASALTLIGGVWIYLQIIRPYIEARNRSEQLLYESEQHFRDLIEGSLQGTIIHRDFKPLFANQAYADFLGFESPEEIVAQGDLLGLFTEAERGRMRDYNEARRSGAEAPGDFEVEMVRKDGKVRWLEHRVRTVSWHGETATQATVNDITERKRAVEALHTAKNEAEQASFAKSEFLATMSHELRTPLNAIVGFSDILHRDVSDLSGNDEHAQYVDYIKSSSQHLLELINDILDLSKIEAGCLTLEEVDFDLGEMLSAASAAWGASAWEKGLEFSFDIDPEMPMAICSDPVRLRQILFNLVGNAVKFTPQGGVRLGASFRAMEDGRLQLRFEVTDTGIGIAAEALPDLFGKFSQADSSTTRRFGGTGLGLAISKQLAEMMGGEIGAESAPGGGATFWFTIRCREGDRAGEMVAVADNDATPRGIADEGRPLRILVAEDHVANQAIVTAILQRAGHRADVVANGLEAVSAVLRTPYDVVLIDIQMPEMDGPTATREIRRQAGSTRQIPIIALTANAMAGDREAYLAAGMDEYVVKPIDPERLFAAIGRCLTGEYAVSGGSAVRQSEPDHGEEAIQAIDSLL